LTSVDRVEDRGVARQKTDERRAMRAASRVSMISARPGRDGFDRRQQAHEDRREHRRGFCGATRSRERADRRPQRAKSSTAVPTISRFFGIVIAMFFDDHGYPHFHARHADGEAKVRIDNLEVIDSTLGRRQLRLELAWAELHQDELAENWRDR
jgi:Domain of unknown function (DUF4160)